MSETPKTEYITLTRMDGGYIVESDTVRKIIITFDEVLDFVKAEWENEQINLE